MSNGSDKRKQSLYFTTDVIEEIQREADRQGRSLSWLVQRAWEIARPVIAKLPDQPVGPT